MSLWIWFPTRDQTSLYCKAVLLKWTQEVLDFFKKGALHYSLSSWGSEVPVSDLYDPLFCMYKLRPLSSEVKAP